MARLTSIFTGKTKRYCEHGITFQTAIKKLPVEGQVIIDYSGLVGNEVANHKNAIYAFTEESYRFWQEHSSLEITWEKGLLGENLVITKLNEKALFIGDTLQIGEVILQVSGCRTPCANLLWRLNAPEDFLPKFQQSGHSGFYLEVLATGVIKAGDKIQHIPCQTDSISVFELAQFFMKPTPDSSELTRLLNIVGMGQQMLSMLTASLNAQRERELVFTDRWSGWQTFTISKIVVESTTVKSFYLTNNTTLKGVAGYRAGQYLPVKIQGANGEQLIRCWSLSDYDEILQEYRISIKREPEGNASQRMHDHYSVGDKLELMPPTGQFTLKRNEIAVPVILISAGVGITPMVSMLKSHAKRLDKTLPTLHFIHSTQNAASHALKGEVDSIIEQHENFHQYTVYTRPIERSMLGRDFQSDTRLKLESLTDILAGMGCWFSEKWIDITPPECHYYLCGPVGFISEIKTMLSELGVSKEFIFSESFANALTENISEEQSTAKVSFSTSKKQVTWLPEKPLTLLELAEENGLEPAFSCRNGQCGLCETEIINGDVNYVIQPATKVAEKKVLLCCSIPKGNVELQL